MSKWEEDMIEQIRKESEDIQIPDSLRPDQIEKRLTEMQIRFILEVEPPVLWAQIVYVVS